MVDPNRKINRLTDKDIEFLDECDDEFANRFTGADEDFLQHCSKPLADPPVVENWNFGGSGGQQNNRGGHAHYSGARDGGGSRNNRGWRGNRYNYRSARHNPYESRRDREGGEPSSHPPIKIRRDYSNFVAASKD